MPEQSIIKKAHCHLLELFQAKESFLKKSKEVPSSLQKEIDDAYEEYRRVTANTVVHFSLNDNNKL